MKRHVLTAVALTALTILALTYGRWLASDLLWLHEQRQTADALARIQSMQGARR